MEAEYVACFLATQEAIWLRSFLKDLSLTPMVDDPVELMCDKMIPFILLRIQSTGKLSILRCIIILFEMPLYISTSKMIVDPLTKPIHRDAFKAHVLSLGLRRL